MLCEGMRQGQTDIAETDDGNSYDDSLAVIILFVIFVGQG